MHSFEAAVAYVLENKEWIFSGIGLFILTLFFTKKKGNIKMIQKAGKSSSQYQSAGNMNVGKNND